MNLLVSRTQMIEWSLFLYLVCLGHDASVAFRLLDFVMERNVKSYI
jgi:hypothetical protein